MYQNNIRSAQETLAFYQSGRLPSLAVSRLVPDPLPVTAAKNHFTTQISVENQDVVTSLFIHQQAGQRIGVMNFASARYPGGGFLQGANAQEEAICRCSFLYPELVKFQHGFYDRISPDDHLYSDTLIASRDVYFVKRPENGVEKFVAEPILADVVSVAAPNRRLLAQQVPIAVIEQHLRNRIWQTLRVFKENDCRILILGAFGCGVFGNDPEQVARLFQTALTQPEFQGQFAQVVFAIYDRGENLWVFQQVLAKRKE